MFLFVFSNLGLYSYQMGPATASHGEPLSRYTTFTDQLQESMPQYWRPAGGFIFFLARGCRAKDSLAISILGGEHMEERCFQSLGEL